MPQSQPVPVGCAHPLLLDANHVRVLRIRMFACLLQLRHRIFGDLAPLPLYVHADHDHIGARFVASGDPTQEELRSWVVHPNLGRLTLEFNRVSQFERKAGSSAIVSGGFNRTSSRMPFQVSSAQTWP